MSIRTYIFGLLTSLVLAIAIILSFQSASTFIGSFDIMAENIMSSIAEDYPEEGRVEQMVLNYHVTSDWSRVPVEIKRQFSDIVPENNVLYTKFVDWIYIAPPEKVYALMTFERAGQLIYVSRFDDNVRRRIKEDYNGQLNIDPVMVIILVGFAGIVLFVIVLLYIFKRVALPMESLQQWATQLKLTELNNARPDFKFRELNDLAKLIHDNLISVADAVEREKVFLSYASHELRTPIAVMRSNSALLEKVNPDPSEKERAIRDRIQRASLTMKSMTETLLWLSHNGDSSMPIETTSLGALVDNTQFELAYLLAGKTVEVKLDIDQSLVPLAVTPSLIVLNNLIRNAFQHTQQGSVEITQRGDEVTIINVESEVEESGEYSGELGFGLGMQLVEKLTTQFNWPFSVHQDQAGFRVTVKFTGH